MIKLYNNTFSDKLYTYFATKAGITILQAIDFFNSFALLEFGSGYSKNRSDFDIDIGDIAESFLEEMTDFFSSMSDDPYAEEESERRQLDASYMLGILGSSLESIKRKIHSSENQPFNIFEEYLLNELAELLLYIYSKEYWHDRIKELYGNKPFPFLPDVARETQVENHLVQEFSFSGSKAKRYAKLMCRIWEMVPDYRKQYNHEYDLFFENCNYKYIFDRGFLKGMQFLKSPKGTALGYGSDYVVNMYDYDFRTGIPIPLFDKGELPNDGRKIIQVGLSKYSFKVPQNKETEGFFA